MAIILLATLVLSVVSGWLLPILFKSRRPFGLLGDVLIVTVPALILAFVEWTWLLPALGFESGWIKVVAAIGDPVGLGWLLLWVARKIKS
jgi:uncharacterized membrane protein YeaQ/YmgE (transglycosylase-associated protein family)